MHEAWIELTRTEYDAAWNAFDEKFRFRPCVCSLAFPGIKEPVPSRTYRISKAYCDDRIRLERDLSVKALLAFQKVIPEGETMLALDWQHPGYHFDLHRLGDPANLDAWKVPVLPDGDYYIFLSRDMGLGLFGHPWEQSICIFGQEFLDAIATDPPELFGKPIAVNGSHAWLRKIFSPAKIF